MPSLALKGAAPGGGGGWVRGDLCGASAAHTALRLRGTRDSDSDSDRGWVSHH